MVSNKIHSGYCKSGLHTDLKLKKKWPPGGGHKGLRKGNQKMVVVIFEQLTVPAWHTLWV